ncbi:MAG: hypothetical protein WBO36_00290, partial [Saprospiraceae bacterium]
MSSTLFVESIRVSDGKICNLDRHQSRFDRTRLSVFNDQIYIGLSKKISVPDEFSTGEVKCRVIYNSTVQDISFEHYQPRKIASLQIIYDDRINYSYKY